jgi:RNA polymerase sigma-70 factor (ECF subfamily)
VPEPQPAQPDGDHLLLQKFRDAGTRQYAFYQLVQKYQQQLYRIIRRMVLDHDDANDVLQEVLVKVYKGLDGFRADAKLSTWMYRIATNETLTFLRRKKTRFFLPIMDVEKMLTDRLDNGALMEADELQKKLQRAILSLPERQRVVFQMRYFDELPYEDIAQVLGVSEGALKASYHHAMKKIEKYMLEG